MARIAFVQRAAGSTLEAAASVQAIAEGLLLAAFNADRYKSRDRCAPPPERMTVVAAPGAGAPAALEQALERGRILGESSNLARDLCNEPANVLTPSVFADRGAAICREAGLSVEILDEDEIARLQMGLLLGVSQGSAEPPRVLVMTHEPAGAPASPVLGLVGKGITFDTGGISIKPADGMERMKDDMAGGAAVICAMRAIALLDAPIKVIGIVPASENMPGGRATKPGDVLTGAGGKTVEVLNTDAEGRLILGDGLWYAQRLGATHLVDVATLTGACVVALGKAASGLFGAAAALGRRDPPTSSARAGDRAWPMPLYDEYLEQMKSEIADMVNTGGRAAGACTAAMFLKEFAGRPAVGAPRHRGDRLGGRAEAVAAEGPDRRGRANARRAGVHEQGLEIGNIPRARASKIRVLHLAKPIIVRVVETPEKSTTIVDVLLGSLGLTGGADPRGARPRRDPGRTVDWRQAAAGALQPRARARFRGASRHPAMTSR